MTDYDKIKSKSQGHSRRGSIDIGKVTTRYPETYEVGVTIKGSGSELKCPIVATHRNDNNIPIKGTYVFVGYTKANEGIVLGELYTSEDIQNVEDRDELYDETFDLETGERLIGHPLSHSRIFYDEDGNIYILHDNDETKIEIEDDNVNVISNGDINISAPNGDVYIDEGGETKRVATEDHRHEYSWTNSGGSSTTEPPDDITEVELE